MLCGMALVPDEETQRRVIDFQGKHMHTLNGPKLGTETNLPHVTVFQSRFNPKDLSRSDLVEILDATVTCPRFQPQSSPRWLTTRGTGCSPISSAPNG